ncbi:MAG: hypothetical protein KDB61_06955 [Planctomycetes bacterium]|nr:hypothetical protein [Planctomycetota bacterium]
MSDEFFSFDEALNELRLKEEELKRLVSEGEIRAFRKGETMKLRRSDVESLRNELQGGEVVDLGDDLVEELVFEEEPGQGSESEGLATQAISDLDTILEDGAAPEMTQVIDGDLDLDLDEDLELEEVLDADLEDDMPLVAGASMGTGRIAKEEPEEEMISAGYLAAVLVSSILMVMLIPVIFSLATGRASGMAKAIAGMFAEIPQ